MSIPVNIGPATDQLSSLMAAVERGEEVIIARAGKPKAKLVPYDLDSTKLDIAAKRRAFFGSVEAPPEVADREWFAPLSDEELALFYGGPPPLPRNVPD